MAELPHLGQQCQVCFTLDFLPITCVHCNNVFCKDHHIFHKCTPEIELKKSEAVKGRNVNDFVNCHFCSITVPLIESSPCLSCQFRFCLTHRHQKDHMCVALKQNESESSSKLSKSADLEAVLAKIRSSFNSGITVKNRGKKNNALANKVMLMKLKSIAVGQQSIPVEEREYFYLCFVASPVSFEQDHKVFKDKPIFLCREWSIGKCVDWIASNFDLINKNNQPDKPKLVLSNEAILNQSLPDQSCRCCDSCNNYMCFGHILKDLIAKNILSITEPILVTYLSI